MSGKRPKAKWLFACAAILTSAFSALYAQELPSATNVMARVVERASKVAASEKSEPYCYKKLSIIQELNSKGQVIESTEKKYEVVLIQGWPFSRLVQVQGQKLSETEMRREEQKEQEFRNKAVGRDLKRMRAKREVLITPELIDRFNFTVISNALHQGRKILVLEFKPKPNYPENTVQDRIYDRFAGLLWVDTEDAEIAQVEVHLIGDLSLGWLGMLGSLRECNLCLCRQRMPEGVWVNTTQKIFILGRKLLSTIRYRSFEESTDFHRAPPSSIPSSQ